ncbi:MAG: tripartite tricarboxylate transporter substrate binding protein [Ectothiorhodospiraceae bacterium]|nr:tripartite tricarboxylate transporter substrate binding protein [Chromatiales bacterium]MCP5153881.1 tripartite tricarboxylate transporter substrate binding protein [Ectothiorhodospiraceae bacterium]
MTFTRGTVLAASLAVALGASVAARAQDSCPQSSWEPKKPVDFVIMAGQGGGADKMARLMQVIIEKHNFSPKPFVPVNKAGGSGAEALVYMKGKQGDDHTVMVTLNSFYTTPLRQKGLGVDITTFSPIARMAEDTFVLWVHKDSGIKSVEDFVAAAKAKGNDWIMAGTGKAQEDQLLTDFLNRTYGLNMKYVPFKGGGAVAKQLAGKHADSTVNNPSEALGFYQNGDVVPIAAFTPQRLEMFKEAPTMRELGKEMVYYMQRSVVGAPKMSDDAQAFYCNVFKKVYASEEWQAYMKKQSLAGEFLTGKPLSDYWVRERDNHAKMLKEIGEL